MIPLQKLLQNGLPIGIGLLALTFLLYSFTHVPDSVLGVLTGLGAGLIFLKERKSFKKRNEK